MLPVSWTTWHCFPEDSDLLTILWSVLVSNTTWPSLQVHMENGIYDTGLSIWRYGEELGLYTKYKSRQDVAVSTDIFLCSYSHLSYNLVKWVQLNVYWSFIKVIVNKIVFFIFYALCTVSFISEMSESLSSSSFNFFYLLSCYDIPTSEQKIMKHNYPSTWLHLTKHAIDVNIIYTWNLWPSVFRFKTILIT